jgi:hypothetical protein
MFATLHEVILCFCAVEELLTPDYLESQGTAMLQDSNSSSISGHKAVIRIPQMGRDR